MNLLACAGWSLALMATVYALVGRHTATGTQERIARVGHELRGPLAAARLGLHLATRGEPLTRARIRAIDLELERAGLAVEDLSRVDPRPWRRRMLWAHGRGLGLGVGPATGLASGPGPGPASGHGPGPASGPGPPTASFDVGELLADSLEAWRAGASARGATVELKVSGAPVVVNGNRLRLAQAAANLVANAVEHGGGAIEVRCRGDATTVRLEVVDEGPGLPAPVAEIIRRPRAGRGSRGRGLAIAAAMASAYGGRLAAAPSERGARLVLELPRARGAMGESGAPRV